MTAWSSRKRDQAEFGEFVGERLRALKATLDTMRVECVSFFLLSLSPLITFRRVPLVRLIQRLLRRSNRQLLCTELSNIVRSGFFSFIHSLTLCTHHLVSTDSKVSPEDHQFVRAEFRTFKEQRDREIEEQRRRRREDEEATRRRLEEVMRQRAEEERKRQELEELSQSNRDRQDILVQLQGQFEASLRTEQNARAVFFCVPVCQSFLFLSLSVCWQRAEEQRRQAEQAMEQQKKHVTEVSLSTLLYSA